MKSNKKINQEVEDTFKVLEKIENVNVNHFFKHKVLSKFLQEKEEKKSIFSWFTPQFQLATLSIVLLLNASVIFYSYKSSESSSNTNIDTFAQKYSLQSSTNSILN
jgi:hypothetical protein